MRRKLVTYPNPILHQPAKSVERVDDAVRRLLAEMVETMYAEDGVGLAAPQVGEGVRLAVIDLSGSTDEPHPGLLQMVNPEILAREGEVEWEEGCLSVPGFRLKMKRARKVKVRFLDEKGVQREFEAEGLLAIAIQQELDHLDGRLILDCASHLKQDLYLRKRRKEMAARDK